MSSLEFRPARTFIGRCGIGLVAFLVLSLVATSAHAEISPGYWGGWWLPTVRSEHGPAVDSLFYWIFWITMVTFVVVEAVLVIFAIKYRSRPEKKKAFFTHGNTKLEMAWTIAPAIILAALALDSKKVWDNYRYSPSANNPDRATILVIGQQFKWNFVYPGPDGKLGRYLLFPHPTDAKWPVGADGKDTIFDDVPGPASLPYDKAVGSINKYIDQENPLGKDFSDPDGKDDDWSKAPGRGLVLPGRRPIEVVLSSKDVIHDFFLPNFRVKLDALPGMRGHIYFTATMTSAEKRKTVESTVSLDELGKIVTAPGGDNTIIVIDESAPGTAQNKNKDATGWRYIDPARPRASIMRNGGAFSDPDTAKARVESLRSIGLTEVKIQKVIDDGNWELVCEELCGQGHNTMNAPLTLLSNEEYDKRNLDKPYHPAAASAQ